MESFDTKEFLLFALQHFELKIKEQNGNTIEIEKDYSIEIEGASLFKLLQNGQVIAPFSDVEELCGFIKKDIQINEQS